MKHYLTEKIEYDGKLVTDIFKKFIYIDNFKNDIKFYLEYYIKEGDTPEMVAYRFYGSTDWWWVICTYNEIMDPFYDWPLTYDEIESLTKKIVIDWLSNPSVYNEKLTSLLTENETKKKIKILKPEYLPQLVKEIKGLK